MATKKKPKARKGKRARKRTSDRVSENAATVLLGAREGRLRCYMAPNTNHRVWLDVTGTIVSIAASCLSQDEQKGPRR